ncbi:hypothetical protein [Carboxylicivirga sp. N1Y90]|uniref:hypothetical protein n=1 Tax=Carboxylicivirga fragile TaxID=3417571 RepID=UPI003D350D15|nr:hypothetical protein [Marinilabiliaceae bacterium N1Y90]
MIKFKIALLSLVTILVVSSSTVAQEKEIGGGLTFISETYASPVGFSGRYYHYLNEELRLVPMVDLAFGDFNVFDIAAGAHFLPEFANWDPFRYYFAAYVDYSYLWKDEFNDSGLGVQLQFGGFEYKLDDFKFFAESGIRFGGPNDYDPWVTRIGVVISLD